jgi:hypothetical protein
MRPRPPDCSIPEHFLTQYKETDMKYATLWSAALLLVVISLAGCSANTKFNDDEYRPLGDPQATRDA